MSDSQLPITGYLDRFSHRPGETFSAFLSLRNPGPYSVRLVRVVCGDPNPRGPGMNLQDRASVFAGTFEGRNQPIASGSYGIIPRVPTGDPAAARTWTVLIRPGLTDRTQAVIAEQSEGRSVVVAIGPDGASAELPGGTRLQLAAPIRKGCWYRLWLSVHPDGPALLGQQAVDGGPVTVACSAFTGSVPAGGTVTIAARDPESPTGHFSGRVQDPAIRQGFAANVAELASLPILAAWDFSRLMSTQDIEDTGPDGCHGRLVNMPTRAVAGARWSGREMCWRHAPEDYAAIHFHADDLGDCQWQPDFTNQTVKHLPRLYAA